MNKKHFSKIFILGFLLLALSACQKPNVNPGVSLQEVLITYDFPGYLHAVAVTADGTVFAICFDADYQLLQYNALGECTQQYNLDPVPVIQAIAASEDGHTVYFTGKNSANGMALLSLDTATGEIEVLYEFSYFEQVKKIVCLEDRIYVLGQQQWGSTSWEPGSDYDFSAGEMLVYYSLDTGDVYQLGFESPINISTAGNGNLMVLGYLPANGYCLMEYDPQADSMEIRLALDAFKFDEFASCNSGGSLLYHYYNNPQGLVMLDLDQPELEVEVYEDALMVDTACVQYAGGRVYCQDSLSGCLVSFPLDQVQRQNKEIRLITGTSLSSSPYGCGYSIQTASLSWDQISLKVLAQDRNFDLCMGASDYDSSQTLKNSDSFYPLNDVPGVQEYLDRCFPYVREAATKEGGMIWMLPFSVWTSGLAVWEEALQEAGIALHDNMTYSELAQVVHGLSNSQRKQIYFLPYAGGRAFVRQYLSQHDTLQDSLFLETLQSLSMLYFDLPGGRGVTLCEDTTFGADLYWDAYMMQQYEEQGVSLYSHPKGSTEDKNIMACYFLAVNPSSSRLSETLSYIADLAAYLTKRNDILYFEDYDADPGSFMDQVHELFRDGDIPFTISWDIYGPDFEPMLTGTLPVEEYIKETERKLQFYYGE